MSFYSAVLTGKGKEKVVVPASSTLNIASITLDTARKSKGAVQVWAKAADSTMKAGAIIGVLSSEAKNCHIALNIQFSESNSPVQFWVVGDGQVHLVGSMDPNETKKKDASAKTASKKKKLEESVSVVDAEVPTEEKAPKNKKQKVNATEKVAAVTTVAKAAETEVTTPKPVNMRKFWKVKPQNEEGVLVKSLKTVYKTKDLKTVDYVIGNGIIPNPGATVKVVYTGLFPDGTVFDSKMKRLAPFVFRKGVNQVVKGLDLGMEGMKVGGSREITIPPELG